jgi:acetoin utilization protein AcuB
MLGGDPDPGRSSTRESAHAARRSPHPELDLSIPIHPEGKLMSRFPLDVERYMSTALVVISPVQPLSEAIRLMRLHDVRHLPVLKRNKVVGVLSQRDVYMMQSIENSAPSQVQVSEAMTDDPYTVEPDERINRVAREMVRRRIGTALITHGDRLLGMFTTTDALLALAALVEDDGVADEPAEMEPALRTKARRKPVAKRTQKTAVKRSNGKVARRVRAAL